MSYITTYEKMARTQGGRDFARQMVKKYLSNRMFNKLSEEGYDHESIAFKDFTDKMIEIMFGVIYLSEVSMVDLDYVVELKST